MPSHDAKKAHDDCLAQCLLGLLVHVLLVADEGQLDLTQQPLSLMPVWT